MPWSRRKILRLGTVLCVLVLTSPLAALGQEEDTFAERISLEALVAHVRMHNPEIQAAEQRYRAAQARPSQAGSLPDPMIEWAYHNEPITPFTLGKSDFSFWQFSTVISRRSKCQKRN